MQQQPAVLVAPPVYHKLPYSFKTDLTKQKTKNTFIRLHCLKKPLEEIFKSNLNVEVCVVFERVRAGLGPWGSHQAEADLGSGAETGTDLSHRFVSSQHAPTCTYCRLCTASAKPLAPQASDCDRKADGR